MMKRDSKVMVDALVDSLRAGVINVNEFANLRQSMLEPINEKRMEEDTAKRLNRK